MYVCMYVCVYVIIYVCMYVCMYVFMYVCMCPGFWGIYSVAGFVAREGVRLGGRARMHAGAAEDFRTP